VTQDARIIDRQMAGRGGRLDWSLCVATIGRTDMLLRCIRLALRQTLPPREVIIVDASDGWEEARDRIRAEMGDGTVDLIYLRADLRSSAVQRNQAIAAASSDILMMFDDDSLMHPDCAMRIMDVYEADVGHEISGISARNHDSIPDERTVAVPPPTADGTSGTGGGTIKKNVWLSRNRSRMRAWHRNSPLFRWLMIEVMLMAMDKMFVPYDAHRLRAPRSVPEAVRNLDVAYRRYLPGYGLTVRRKIAAREPFDPHLLAYCPNEDLDASYRWGRHGVILACGAAHLHHYEAASGRIKRNKATILAVTNVAFFIRQHSDAFSVHMMRFYVLMARRLLAETIKDLIMGRVTLPQARGVVEGLVLSVRIFRHPRLSIGDWYVELQRRIIA